MGVESDRTVWNARVAEANRAAVLHPQTEPDALPCLDVAGVLAFLYLEPDHRALRLSLDLDTAPEWLQRQDSTIPVRITINGVEVFADVRPEDGRFDRRRRRQAAGESGE